MAENKKAVLLYCDLIHTVEALTDIEAGALFKHYLRYVNDLNPEPPDRITQITFEPIKQALKRDLKKWEQTCSGRVEPGRLGGIKSGETRRKQKEANEAIAFKTKQSQANEADTVSDTVIVNDTVKDIVKETVKEEPINSIDRRKLKFASTLEIHLVEFGKDFLNEFFSYWTEPNHSKTKMRFELEKTWDLKKRLARWAKNDKNFKLNNTNTSKYDTQQANKNELIQLRDAARFINNPIDNGEQPAID